MTLEVLESAATFDLPDRRVVTAGDWHGKRSAAGRAISVAGRTGVRTMVHVGDFGFWPTETTKLLATVDRWAARSREYRTRPGIERILVTPGNREDWAELTGVFGSAPGAAVRVSEVVWVLPRGFRFTIGGRSFLSFGGAASVDYQTRIPHREWWVHELPSAEDVKRAVAGGPVEILISHDVGDQHTPCVEAILRGRGPWLEGELAYAAVSRNSVAAVVESTRPRLHLHGHYHVRDSAVFPLDGRAALHVESLARADRPGNLALLDVESVTVADVAVRR